MDKIFHSLINENEQDNQNIVFDHKRKRSDEDDIEPPVRLGISTSNDNLLEMSAQILSSISSTTKEPTRLNELCNVCGKSLDIHLSPCGVAESVAYDKPYVCKEQGCGKTYKNANGLKYHKIHGHCEGTTIDDDQLSYKLQRPYECSFECPKRYKNLNGVKYHLEKSHGMEKQKAAIHATEIVCLTHVKYGIVGRNVDPEVLQNAIRNAEGKSEKMSPPVQSKNDRLNLLDEILSQHINESTSKHSTPYSRTPSTNNSDTEQPINTPFSPSMHSSTSYSTSIHNGTSYPSTASFSNSIPNPSILFQPFRPSNETVESKTQYTQQTYYPNQLVAPNPYGSITSNSSTFNSKTSSFNSLITEATNKIESRYSAWNNEP